MSNAGKLPGLVADIGGTNGRFALVSPTKDVDRREYAHGEVADFTLGKERRYQCADFANLADMVAQYLSDTGGIAPRKAVIAVAGPVVDNCCEMTNLHWRIDGGKLCEDGVFSSCLIVNDFAALAASLPLLESRDVIVIGRAGVEQPATRLVVGPGTGLGAAYLAPAGSSSFVVITGEGGHMGFSPVDEVEEKLARWFTKKYSRCSMERILSGQGLVDLFEALGEFAGQTRKSTAVDIMTRGLAEEGPERATLECFCAVLGGFAGDLALAGGCWRGVYIGGGILPRMPQILAASRFRHRFEDKGRFTGQMRRVPTSLITRKSAALAGAASHLAEL